MSRGNESHTSGVVTQGDAWPLLGRFLKERQSRLAESWALRPEPLIVQIV